jgi:hypothetical protein
VVAGTAAAAAVVEVAAGAATNQYYCSNGGRASLPGWTGATPVARNHGVN